MKKFMILFALIAVFSVAKAQKSKPDTSSMPGMDMKPHKKAKPDTGSMPGMDLKPHKKAKPMKGMDMGGMQMDNMPMGKMDMSSSQSLNLPMNRDGSGTGWLPDGAPMYGIMLHSVNWSYMLHGSIFPRYTSQDISSIGSRGAAKFDAPNWIMAMAQRAIGAKGLLHFNLMLSADALTEGGYGYPLLFQSGENWQGMPLVNRQHPHDLFSEASVSYAYALSKTSDLSIYVGYPGEPALGPVAFMHRPSAMDNPDAPISHHWSDATHITFGVATVGFRLDQFKLEASLFTGREPDENRYNFDQPRFDSYSARLNFNPSANWALQVSHGFIKSPEATNPAEDIHRTTASAIYSRPFDDGKFLNASAIWGMNKPQDHDGENSILLEGDLSFKRASVYTRYEWVQKTTEELNLNPLLYSSTANFAVNALTVGLNYDITNIGPLKLALGGQLTYYNADSRLDNLYGKSPIGGEVFFKLSPRIMKM